MQPVELRARREALGLSQIECARLLDVAQNTVSRWEAGKRAVPDGLDGELRVWEDTVERLAARAVAAVELVDDSDGPAPVLFSWLDDESFWAAHPEMDGTPAVLHRVAMARAAHLCGAAIVTMPD